MDDWALSLERIERDVWPAAPVDATRLVRRAHELRRTPVGELTPEDLRLLLAQRIGVEVLVPRALTVLTGDPLAAGDFHPGDLLLAVVRLPSTYWDTHPDQAGALRGIVGAADIADAELRAAVLSFLSR